VHTEIALKCSKEADALHGSACQVRGKAPPKRVQSNSRKLRRKTHSPGGKFNCRVGIDIPQIATIAVDRRHFLHLILGQALQQEAISADRDVLHWNS
jgi:hypothetical protein